MSNNKVTNTTVKKNPVGRTNEYETIWKHRLDEVEEWASMGLSNLQIANNMNIGDATLYDWQNKHPEFRDTIKRGKYKVDLQVENALFKKALGTEYTEVKKVYKNGKVIGEERVTKQLAPDTTAQIFWLKNRQPQDWRDRRHIEHEGSMEVNNPLAGLTTEELRKMANAKPTE